jgi:hypothetical protein
MVQDIDQNKAKLCNKDAKFFIITVSPSADELKAIGQTEAERSKNLKKYVREEVMKLYAEGFGKGLTAAGIKYYAKIHYSRGEKEENQMHAHIIVSRKDMENKLKLSPMTNHRNASRSGTVKSGFDKNDFREKCNFSFDRLFSFERNFQDTWEYQNTLKNGTYEDKIALLEKTGQIVQVKLQESEQNENKYKEIEKEILSEVRPEKYDFLKEGLSKLARFKAEKRVQKEFEDREVEKYIEHENKLKNAKIEPKKPKQRNRNLSREEEDLEL